MSEKELRAKLGDKRFEELAALVTSPQEMSEEEIMMQVKRRFGNAPTLESIHIASPH